MGLRRILPVKYVRRVPARLGKSQNRMVLRAYGGARTLVRRTVNTVTPLQLGWVATLQTAHWRDDTVFEISGWAFERGFDFGQADPVITVRLHARGWPDLHAEVTPYVEPLANTRAGDGRQDYSRTGFVARFDVAEIVRLGGLEARTWRVLVDVGNGRKSASGGFKRRAQLGSAHQPFARVFDGVQVLPSWDDRSGLRLQVVRPAALALAASVDDRTVTADLVLNGIRFARAEIVSPQARVAMVTKRLHGGGLRVSGEMPPIDPHGPSSLHDPDEDEGLTSPEPAENTLAVVSARIDVLDSRGRRHGVATVLGPTGATEDRPLAPPFLYPGPDGTLRVRDTPAMMIITEAVVEAEPHVGVRLRGRVMGDLEGARLMLVGPRARRSMQLQLRGDGTFEAFGAWLASQWGEPDSPPPSGRYTVRGQTAAGEWFRVAVAIGLVEDAPETVDLPGFRCVVGIGDGRRLAFSVQPLLAANEIGVYRQTQLARRYHRASLPVVDQFYFESFAGTLATCNPYALDRELARRLPDVPRFWGVADAAVPVPDGAVQVVQGTEAWWKARQSSRFVVANEWLKATYRHLPEQVVLQTWHGTMLKRIGLDRPTADIVVRRALLEERSKWDVLLSQNPHSTEIFRRAYAWDKEIWEEGYPRNDALLTGDRGAVRRGLGIRDDQVAVLYAPTWRENRSEMVTFLDLEKLVAALGERYVLLLRGHSRTLNAGSDVHLPGVIDVTSHPNVTDLFLAADAMITDYSSVMFDFSVTGRPMIFFVPDMDDYRDALRGVYFDLSEVAPGPVLDSQDDVVDAIVDLEASAPAFADRYRAWQERFNPHDDGHSASRVIDRLLELR